MHYRASATGTACVKTINVDLHGRYVVHFFYTDKKDSLSTVFSRGTYLNDLLLHEKHARRLASV